MTVKAITAKEARALLNKLGLEVNDSAKTFYAKSESDSIANHGTTGSKNYQ